MSVAKYFDEMSYGPAPEADTEARDWLKRHAGAFGHFINGDFRPSSTGKSFATFEPATGAQLATLANGSAEDVDAAVAAARKAQAAWAKLPGHQRARHLYAIARMIQRHGRLLAVVEAIDNGKPVRETRDIDIPLVARHFYHHAGWASLIASEFPGSRPVGVCGQIVPWNFPLLMLAWKIGPALASGCSVVVKPAQETTLTTLLVAELAVEAGIPAGVFNVVTGGGKEVGEPIGLHMDVDMVAFTGSTPTGRRFLRYAADSNLKRVVLECGGKNPAVVLDDAEDLDLVAEQVVNGAFWNMGENCSATSRLIVQSGVKDELLKRIGEYMREWKTGDPLDPDNRIGALVSKTHFDKVASFLDDVKTEKLKVAHGGKTIDGVYIEPTVVNGVGPQSRLFREEIFGPILSVTTFETLAEAIALANDTNYGLTASVYTASLRNAIRLSREIRAGVVTVNCFGEGDASTPFGGYKESGFGGRDKSIFAHDNYCELKTIWIDLSERSVDETIR